MQQNNNADIITIDEDSTKSLIEKTVVLLNEGSAALVNADENICIESSSESESDIEIIEPPPPLKIGKYLPKGMFLRASQYLVVANSLNRRCQIVSH